MPERRHMILCTVTDVKDAQVVYPCCSQCCSKLRSDCFQDRWQCLKCGCSTSSDDLEWRYRLSLMVTDGPVLTNISLFGSVLQQFFGLSSKQFVWFLRRIENMYGNAEDVLLLGLRHCFIGNYYYFGIKASTSLKQAKSRVGLSDVVHQRRTACQNASFTQEDSPSTVAFQMVPAVNSKSYTVYEIIQNYFHGPKHGVVESKDIHNKENDTCEMSSMNVNSTKSRSNAVSRSCISLGQSTALLSCELSALESTNQTSLHKPNVLLTKDSNNASNQSQKMENFIETPVGKQSSSFKKKRNRTIMISNRENEIHSLSRKHNNSTIENLKMNAINFNNYFENVNHKPRFIEQDKDYINSEPLFSQDNIHGSEIEILRTDASQSSITDDMMKSFANITASLDGTQLLDHLKLKAPVLPENVPDSEELELYLLNDSSFGEDGNFCKAVDTELEDVSLPPSACGLGTYKEGQAIQNNGVKDNTLGEENTKDSQSYHVKKLNNHNHGKIFDNYSSISRSGCSDKIPLNGQKEVPEKIVSKNLETAVSSEQEAERSKDFLETNEVISCAPDLSKSSFDNLCCQFEECLETDVKIKDTSSHQNHKTSPGKLVAANKSTALNLSVNVSLSSSIRHSTNELKSSTDCNNMNLSCIIESQKFENSNNRYTNSISGSHFDCSEDLFGDASESCSQDIPNCSVGEEKEIQIKSVKKSVKFSRRLSYHKSIQLIDLQMKMKSNFLNSAIDSELPLQPCIKATLHTISEKDSTAECLKKDIPDHESSSILSEIGNSPIVNNSLLPASQDLFSPSPDVCLRTKKHHVLMNNHTKKQCNSEQSNKTFGHQHRKSSTPIEDDGQEFNSESFVSIFSNSFEEDCQKENIKPKQEELDSFKNDNSQSLFSQSCSLFSNSNYLSRGDNSIEKSCSKNIPTNSLSVSNYSKDLFSPSVCESLHSPVINMPVKRLFLDKM